MTEPRGRDPRSGNDESQTGPTIRDRRRIDPDTYQVREPQETAAPATGEPASTDPSPASQTGTRSMTENDQSYRAAGQPAEPAPAGTGTETTQEADVSAQLADLQTQVAERTADLQRLQAEYVNYKRRVDRDRDLVRTVAVEGVLRELLSAMDNIARAREHGELTGGFKAVAEEITKVAQHHGLESYGEAGEPFDPNIHDALMHAHADDVTGPTCVQILQPGYRIGDRVLRPAAVAVAEPAEGATPAPGQPAGSSAAPGEPSAAEEPDESSADDVRE